MKEVSTSFLKEGNYEEYINKLNNSNTDYIHFDVMDGLFVENKNLSFKELEKYIKLSKKKNDIHLMVKDPSNYIKILSKYNISYITIHKEIENYKSMISLIKNYGIKVGIAINPETSVESLIEDLDNIDLILVMGVHPGRSGQKYIKESSLKINELNNIRKERKLNFKIGIDGGICKDVLKYVCNADIIVSASFILDDLENINRIKQLKN